MKTGHFFKRRSVRIVSGLALAFGMAAWAAQDGYNMFERADGNNFACDIDPTCRKLTSGEIELSKSIFGDRVEYRHVKVFDRPIVPYWRPPATAYTWKGNIYVIDPKSISNDYAKETEGHYADILTHEMTHVWQFGKEPKFLTKGLFTLILNDFFYDKLYQYDIGDHREFSAFNFEQQGEIIEDYYGMRKAFREKTKDLKMDYPRRYKKSFNAKTRVECRVLDQYAAAISSSLPQVLEPKCQMYRPYVVAPPLPGLDDPPPPKPAEIEGSTVKKFDFSHWFDVQPGP